MEIKEKIEELFNCIDTMDADKFVTYLTGDAIFRFGNAPVVSGKKAIRDAVFEFFKSIKSIGHRCINLWEIKPHVVYEGIVKYTRHDGNIVELNFVNVFKMNGDLIKDYFIYIDITPLYAPM
jgi:hypothetical protein